jgi:disulfide bond formation protein DsbB
MVALQRILNRLWIFVLCGVLIGAFSYQIIESEEPCPLCLLQRLGMIGIATALLLNLRFGIKVEHYGLAILSALIGRIVSLRQISLHVCPQFPTFGQPVFGYDLYVWAFIVFTCSVFAAAVLLIVFGFSGNRDVHPVWNGWDKLAFAAVFLITLANIFTTFMECGLSPCYR